MMMRFYKLLLYKPDRIHLQAPNFSPAISSHLGNTSCGEYACDIAVAPKPSTEVIITVDKTPRGQRKHSPHNVSPLNDWVLLLLTVKFSSHVSDYHLSVVPHLLTSLTSDALTHYSTTGDFLGNTRHQGMTTVETQPRLCFFR